MAGAKRFLFDAHTHVGRVIYARTREELERSWARWDTFTDWMAKYGVDMAAVSSIDAMVYRVWRTPMGGNEDVVEGVRRFPDRVVGYYVPNVYHEEPLLKREVREALDEQGFRGVKFHPWVSGYPANDRLLDPVFEVLEEHRLPALYHSGTAPYCTPLLIADMARRFPDVPVIMGHSGKHELYLDAIPAAKLSQNVYLEMSGNTLRAFYEKAAREVGAHRILFGTDGPDSTVRHYVTLVEELEIGEDEKELILGKNALRIFKLDKR